MTYGVIFTVADDIKSYDRLHHELLLRTGGTMAGLLVHIGRATPDGFEVIEVWETKDHCDRCNQEVIWPLAAQVFSDQAPSAAPTIKEFEVRGLVIPEAVTAS